MRRTFSRAEVWRAWKLQGEVCNLCHRAIPFDLMHGDHILAWSSGGATTVDNLQALCGSCNLRKGTQPQEVISAHFDVDRISPSYGDMRQWQIDAMPVVLSRILEEPQLVEACPGAGKTRFGLEVAYRLVFDGLISRVLIVVPTLAIADGWRKAASAGSSGTPTLPLHTQRDWRPVDPIGDDWLGAIVTYQSLMSSTEMFLAHATDPGQRTLVIFDEVHHAGTDGAWGLSAQEAFADGARGILSLSGTPFRTDQTPIAFVPAVGGIAQPQFRYTYDDAIRDGACRPVQFVEVRGETRFRTTDGAEHSVTFDDHQLTKAGEQARLRSALEWIGEGSIAEKLLADANRYIVALRDQGDMDAGALVVCIDCDHAARVADYISSSVIGHRPIVACSRLYDRNDPDPANAIRLYSASHAPWIVAVNMVSEGVDIPRLRAVVYLTNRLTLLSFRQIVGRVVRTDPNNVDDHGRVYIPADPRLVAMAKAVADEAHLLPRPIVIVIDSLRPRVVRVEGGAANDAVPFEVLQTVGEAGDVFDTNDRQASARLVASAQLFIDREGLTGTTAEDLALAASQNPELLRVLQALPDEL